MLATLQHLADYSVALEQYRQRIADGIASVPPPPQHSPTFATAWAAQAHARQHGLAWAGDSVVPAEERQRFIAAQKKCAAFAAAARSRAGR